MDHLPITSAHTPKSLSNRYQKSHPNPVNVLDLGHTLCIHKSCGCINVGSDMKIQIDIKATDFEQLWTNSMEWVNQDWQKQADRFDPSPLFSWKYAYWFDDYTPLKLAEAFINALGKNYAIHSDEGTDEWVLLTNYASPCHLRKTLVSA